MDAPATVPAERAAPATQFFRLSVVLHITGDTPRLHPCHGALLYALLAEAFGKATAEEPAMPDGLLLDAPEQARVALRTGDRYAFGFTLLAPDRGQAGQRLEYVVRGLRSVGRKATKRGAVLGGNFRVEQVTDLVAQTEWRPGQMLESIPRAHIDDEIARLADHPTLTLRFLAPLRAHRSKHDRAAGQTYFGREYFRPEMLAARIAGRLRSLGVYPPAAAESFRPEHVEVVENRLVWLDLKYGRRNANQSLDGALGRVALRIREPAIVPWLVWGQYVRVGESTRFGHGRFRIEELGPEPFAAPRAASLLDLAFQGTALDRTAEKLQLAPGVASQAAAALIAGQHQPEPHARVTIPARGGARRELAIPSRLDRALQRAVHELLAPAVDQLFEESSFAYRAGLSRQRAAAAIRQAYQRGHRWALKADIARFFDTIDHRELHERLSAYLGDDRLVAAIMAWMRAGAPAAGRGVPTGAPLSPLVANLLLDQFDEQIRAAGGRLVRYADDFMILFREHSQAEAMTMAAREAAEDLCLQLNHEKTALVDLSEPFEYLGFRFERNERWQADQGQAPTLLDDLGWRETAKGRTTAARRLMLPGETDLSLTDPRATLVIGPGVKELSVEREQLIGSYVDQRPPVRISLGSFRELVVLGRAGLSPKAVEALAAAGGPVFLADESGRLLACLTGEVPLDDAEAVLAQADAVRNPAGRLEQARRLVAAKLHNYAALATAAPARENPPPLAEKLAALLPQLATAADLDQLLGYEGAAAAAWYGQLRLRVHEQFAFARRVAPAANDPVNVLLNIGFTYLHRQVQLFIRQVGLVPTLGILHRDRPGHATLASDLQEPLRHLIDRAVIEATWRLRPRDFQSTDRGPFALRILPHAAREFQVVLHGTFAQACTARGQEEPRPYRAHLLAMVRGLKRHLKEPHQPWDVFLHP